MKKEEIEKLSNKIFEILKGLTYKDADNVIIDLKNRLAEKTVLT